jgi:hypothetical protein
MPLLRILQDIAAGTGLLDIKTGIILVNGLQDDNYGQDPDFFPVQLA